jgi:hypothetical protein
MDGLLENGCDALGLTCCCSMEKGQRSERRHGVKEY